jgi:hypothetical protein
MNTQLKQRILDGCAAKIAQKGPEVGLSFYAFFRNKNDEPDLLMQAAEWWIKTHRLDHFEKATKIRRLVEEMDL